MQQKPWGRLRDKARASVVVEARRIDMTEGRNVALEYLKAHGMGGHESNDHRSARRILDYETFQYIDCIPKEAPLWRDQRRLEDAAIARRKLARQSKPQLLERSGGKCEWCGRSVSGSNATIDHIDPDAGNEIENLAILCRSCNARKSSGALERLARIDAAHEERANRWGFKDWEALRRAEDCPCHHYGCEPDCSGCEVCGHDSETMPPRMSCAGRIDDQLGFDCLTPSACWRAHVCQSYPDIA